MRETIRFRNIFRFFNPIINNESSEMAEYAKCCKVTLVIVLNPTYIIRKLVWTFVIVITIRYPSLYYLRNSEHGCVMKRLRRNGWNVITCLNRPLKTLCKSASRCMYYCIYFFSFFFQENNVISALLKNNLHREFWVNQTALHLFDLHQTLLIGRYVIRIWHHFDGNRAWWFWQTIVDLQIWKYNIRRLMYKTVCILMVQIGPSMENGSLSKHYRGTKVTSGN